MTIAQLESFLLWCALFNYGVLLVVALVWMAWGQALHGLHARWFRLDRAQCDFAVYLMLGLYKLAIWFLCLAPWLALHWMGTR